eukprot:1942873-Alexandrium_andersonii.AAC.1
MWSKCWAAEADIEANMWARSLAAEEASASSECAIANRRQGSFDRNQHFSRRFNSINWRALSKSP